MLCRFIQLCIGIVMVCLIRVECSCPSQCWCSNVSAICRSSLTRFPSNLPSEISTLSVNGMFSKRNNITSIQTSYFSSFLNFKRLYMTFGNVNEIPDGAFPTTLLILDISFNKIMNISEGTFSAQTRLRHLHLSGNTGVTISKSAFSGLTMLTELYMAEMNLSVLDIHLFRSLYMLKKLDIHGNIIRSLDWSFTKIANELSYIDISGNLFTVLSNTSVMGLRKIKTIELEINPWRCTCALEWIKMLPSPKPEQVVCSSPDSLKYQSIINVPSSKLICVPASVRCTSYSFIGAYHTQVNISCTYGGDPFPDVIWTRPDGTKLQYYNYDHPNYYVSDRGVLTIKSLSVVDDGVWKLQVNNIKKQNVKSLGLTVTDIPTTTAVSPTVNSTRQPVRTTSNRSTPTTKLITTQFYTITYKQSSTTSSRVQDDNKTSPVVVCVSVVSGIVLLTIVIIIICFVLSKGVGFRFFRRRAVEELHPH